MIVQGLNERRGPRPPFVVVTSHADADAASIQVSRKEATKWAERWGASAYFCTSAKTGTGTEDLLPKILKALEDRPQQSRFSTEEDQAPTCGLFA